MRAILIYDLGIPGNLAVFWHFFPVFCRFLGVCGRFFGVFGGLGGRLGRDSLS